MKKEVWLTRSPEWIAANPGKGTMYKSVIDTEDGQVPANITKELRDEIKKNTAPAIAGIYAIKCEILKTVYIGQSINVDSRLRQHKLMLRRKNRNTKIIAYKQMYKDIDQVGIEAFEFTKYRTSFTVDVDELLRQETQAMHEFLSHGYKLYNTTVNLGSDYIYCPIKYQEQVKEFIRQLMSK